MTSTYTTPLVSRTDVGASWLEMSTTGVFAAVTANPTPNAHGKCQRITTGCLGEVT